ncbi:MAG: hypothetical protein OEV91_04480 [Desulfobulbaceae bacterium]|nr:hypothetical protein [Desulfobulbaceae bacterium]
MPPRTCVDPSGRFVYGLHQPAYAVTNLREQDSLLELGKLENGSPLANRRNFPAGDVEEARADPIYEIPNPLPFRGTTFISQSWATPKAENPTAIRLPAQPSVSMSATLAKTVGAEAAAVTFASLPEPVLLALAATATDAEDLVRLAEMSCEFVRDPAGNPVGLRYQEHNGRIRPLIRCHDLFETVVNNIHLPDLYKQVMVLRPGVQGNSEIVGDYGTAAGQPHIFEYLRRNSYIPWGHYAANMAHDSIRYRTLELSAADMTGLRHLYYQRTYVRFAELLAIESPAKRRRLSEEELEGLRLRITTALAGRQGDELAFSATLWGWNYGYDFSASGFRLHASHQQIHQQFALLPGKVEGWHSGKERAGTIPSYGCGDLVADFCRDFRAANGKPFFAAYLAAIRANQRMDGRDDREQSLIVHEDERVLLFVPKAQTSQWELQIMAKGEVGNILEADSATRASLDRALLLGQRVLALLGARLVTSIEFAKRVDTPDHDQRLLYALLPKLPYSMGAFSEAQLRFISGHFPEDFAVACRAALARA